ncbi:hypothetical protein F5Y13DRAFT_170546 [Hypoxylon sp. FL1857]|nr:hypothetical protein F5Y13DRAFT_170546 [Hypoxylon sp. FL1857]
MYLCNGTFHPAPTASTALLTGNQLGWDGVPPFAETISNTGGRCRVSAPLFDDCTIILLHGAMQLDGDSRIFTGTNGAVRAQGSKALTILENSAAVWCPAPCCWSVEQCPFAEHGRCRRLGMGNVREVKKVRRSWWRRFSGGGGRTLDSVCYSGESC